MSSAYVMYPNPHEYDYTCVLLCISCCRKQRSEKLPQPGAEVPDPELTADTPSGKLALVSGSISGDSSSADSEHGEMISHCMSPGGTSYRVYMHMGNGLCHGVCLES